MLVVMQQAASEAQIQKIIQRLVDDGFDVHRSTGVIHTVLGGVGGRGDFDMGVVELMPGVKEVHRIGSAYKLASRAFRPQGTVVRIRDVEIGGNKIGRITTSGAVTEFSVRTIMFELVAPAIEEDCV